MLDPNCRWCHGTGEIPLAVSVVPCECVTAVPPPGFERDDDDAYAALQTYYRGPLGEAWLIWGQDVRDGPPPGRCRGPVAEEPGWVSEVFRPRLHGGGPKLPGPGELPVTGFGFPAKGGRHPRERRLVLSDAGFRQSSSGVLLLVAIWTPWTRVAAARVGAAGGNC